MIWTECPRCQGESGNWCGGNCHEGGLYVCEHCGHTQEENSEECPCCGRIDEDMRLARLKIEAEDGNVEAAAELYALESGDHDKAALCQAFLAGAGYVGQSAVNADLLEALKAIRMKYGEYACEVCDAADAIIAKAEGGAE